MAATLADFGPNIWPVKSGSVTDLKRAILSVIKKAKIK